VFVVAGRLGLAADWFSGSSYRARCERVIDAGRLAVWGGKNLVTIGSHGMNHRLCSSLSPEEIENELRLSAGALSDILQKPVVHFSYPHGVHDDRTEAALIRQGYRSGYTIEPERISSATNPFRRGRFFVSPFDWQIEFRLKLSGAYRWLPAGFMLKRLVTRGKPKKGSIRYE
jgi:peptidoglycan/xylan/chitin deacetylase (PgdA/CDA1 family)